MWEGSRRSFGAWFSVFLSEPGALEPGGFCHPVVKWLFWERNPERGESSVRRGGQTSLCYSEPWSTGRIWGKDFQKIG